MKHVIIGNGNLGNALGVELLKRGHTIKVFSTSNGWRYPASLDPIYDELPDHVWVTVGAGSVEQAKGNFGPFADLHLKLPTELAQKLNNGVVLHTFSTDYAANKNDIQSLYALSKDVMETALILINKPRTNIYRIGSLYGTHKPQKCFPYKLKKNSLKNEITLPLNVIVPTPTDWLAKTLLNNLEKICDDTTTKFYTVAPKESTTVAEWGSLILEREILGNVMDNSRPSYVSMECNLPIKETVSWLDLWKERENDWREILNKIEI
jgi:hypothetical protein